MADCSKERIKYLCQLAHLQLSDQEATLIEDNFQKVLDYIAQLKEIEVPDLSPYSHMEEQGIDSLREDVEKNKLSRADFLENVPNKVAGLVSVPNVMGKNP